MDRYRGKFALIDYNVVETLYVWGTSGVNLYCRSALVCMENFTVAEVIRGIISVPWNGSTRLNFCQISAIVLIVHIQFREKAVYIAN